MQTAITMAMAAVLAAMVSNAGQAGASSVCGDVNGSNSITASDALSVLKKAVGQEIELLCAPGQLPRTGQTTDYGAGSDGVVQAGAARAFTDNGDGTITDHATGLMWEKKDASGGIHDKDNSYTWTAGTDNMDGSVVTSFLTTLNGGGGFAGHTDWRLPNILELESLRNFEVVNPAAFSAFNDNCTAGCTVTTCSCTLSSYYLSSSTYQNSPSFTWSVDFHSGSTDPDFKTSSARVRAVRAGS